MKCKNCKKELIGTQKIFCSRVCINVGRPSWNKGTKGIMNAWNKGLKGVQKSWNKGAKGLQVAWNKGIPNPSIMGKLHPNWKGTDDKYWRQKALQRDDYTCQNCGYRDLEIMEVDHVKSKAIYPELRFDLNNLQTLCPNCHAKKTREQLRQKRILAVNLIN